eukprot:Pgem_evm1s18768
MFNKTHWVTSEVCIAYLHMLKALYTGEIIGLIWDSHTAHLSDDVLQWVQEENAKDDGTKLVIAVIKEGLTPIVQVSMCL